MTSTDALRKLLDLKDVYRDAHGDRTDSSAEHTWGCIILAQHFLPLEAGLDELRVMKLLLYHDMVEAEVGDTSIVDVEARQGQAEREAVGAERLRTTLPETLAEEFFRNVQEFEAQRTREARFAKAIDKLEPMVYWIDSLASWASYGVDEAFLERHKRPYMQEFPHVLAAYDALVQRYRDYRERAETQRFK